MSTAPFHWTLLFAGACALLQCALTALVIVQRVRSRIDFLDGGDPSLMRRVRAHGNFSETAPMALLLMLLLEWSGVAAAWLVTYGTALLLGRVLHAAGVLGWGGHRARLVGMALTLAALSLGGLWCLRIALASVAASGWALPVGVLVPHPGKDMLPAQHRAAHRVLGRQSVRRPARAAAIARPGRDSAQRELIIPFGGIGNLALFEIVSPSKVVVLGARHQRAEDHH